MGNNIVLAIFWTISPSTLLMIRDEFAFICWGILKKDKTIIGIHIISDEAAELIQLLAVNVVAKNTLDEFRKTVAVHPTSSEEIITI